MFLSLIVGSNHLQTVGAQLDDDPTYRYDNSVDSDNVGPPQL
jgi:hypothetical protein